MVNQGCMPPTYYLEYDRHLASLHRCRRAYTPTSNTASHDNHEKINSWVSFCFIYGYGALLWRILQIKEGIIHRGRRPRWIIPSEICRILHILRKPNSIIALLFIQNISSLLYKHQWNTNWAFPRKLHIFTREDNMLSSHVKRSPSLWLHNKSRLWVK